MPNYRGISPETNGGADLGSTTQKWGKLYANHVLTAGSLYRRRTRKTFTLADLEAAVADGDYAARDIDVGDYYVGASGYTYILAGDNTMKGYVSSNHAALVVNTHSETKWNLTESTAGGYVASNLHSYLVNTALPKCQEDLGLDHLYSQTKIYSTAVDNSRVNRTGRVTGASSDYASSTNQYICALSEIQVFGSIVWSSSGHDTGEANQQLELFRRFCVQEIFGNYLWLRDIAGPGQASRLDLNGRVFNRDTNGNSIAVGLILFH